MTVSGEAPPQHQHWAGAAPAGYHSSATTSSTTTTATTTATTTTTTSIQYQSVTTVSSAAVTTAASAAVTTTSAANSPAAATVSTPSFAGGNFSGNKPSPASSSSSYGGSPCYSGGEESRRGGGSHQSRHSPNDGLIPHRRSSAGMTSSGSNPYAGFGIGSYSGDEGLSAVFGGMRRASLGNTPEEGGGNSVGGNRRALTGEEVQCTVCGRMLCNKYVLKVHIRDMHSPRSAHQCQHCNRCYSTINSLRVHVSTMHNKTSSNVNLMQQQQGMSQQQIHPADGSVAHTGGLTTSSPIAQQTQNLMQPIHQLQQQQQFGGIQQHGRPANHPQLQQQQQHLQQQQQQQQFSQHQSNISQEALLSPKLEFNLHDPQT